MQLLFITSILKSKQIGMIFLNGNKIEVFNSAEFGTVRTLETADGKVFFYGADIAKALGYSNARDALLRHCKRDGVVKHDTIVSIHALYERAKATFYA